MTRHFPRWHRRAALGQAVTPTALLMLVGLAGGLTWHVQRAEDSHRAAAESALRDYAAFAAWQFSREASDSAYAIAHNTMHVLDSRFRERDTIQALPAPDIIAIRADAMACGFVPTARFFFRIDLPSGHISVARDTGGAADGATRAALVARLSEAAMTPAAFGSGVRFLVDTLGGERRAIAWGVIRDREGAPRAIYGVEAPPIVLDEALRSIVRNRPLLPPSLLAGRSIDDVLTLRVAARDGGAVFTLGDDVGPLAASDSTVTDAGGLITTVAIRPAAAQALLIGGVPSSRVPLFTLVLIASVILAGIALVQLRRGRELARLRAGFVANVSHELRTPLAQISMFSETLLLGRERSGEERQQFLSVIYREARRLSQLVESVLSFSRAEAAPRLLRPARHDVAEEVRDAVRAFSPLAAASSVELHAMLEPDAWAMVEPGALRQVMVNLLDNAVKFGPEEQDVTVRVTRVGGDVIVTVDDQGPGIPLSQRTRVFEPFAQVEQSSRQDDDAGRNRRVRSATGAGIGLAVVSELIAMHGGRTWVEDAPSGRGARVAFALTALDDAAVNASRPSADDVDALDALVADGVHDGAIPLGALTDAGASR
jgi:signal transduction histidine kinase